jgi:hypothetical protein
MKKLILILASTLLIISCGKEEKETPAPAKSMREQLEEKPWTIVEYWDQEYENGQKFGPPTEKTSGQVIFKKDVQEVEIFIQGFTDVYREEYFITANNSLFFGLQEIKVVKLTDTELIMTYKTPDWEFMGNIVNFEYYYRCTK